MKKLNMLVILVISVIALAVVIAQPQGATTTRGTSTRGSNPTVDSELAEDGNITDLNIDAASITDIWQGFYGNVTGGIVLENAAGTNFYNWSLASISGEIFAVRSLVADWSVINCSNSTYWETEEATLNIAAADSDGINETYADTAHPTFTVGATSTLTGCPSTRPNDDTEQASLFWNVLLNVNSTTTVYTAIISANSNDYDGGTSDYELLVPVDKATGFATYFFYAELD